MLISSGGSCKRSWFVNKIWGFIVPSLGILLALGLQFAFFKYLLLESTIISHKPVNMNVEQFSLSKITFVILQAFSLKSPLLLPLFVPN